MIKFFLGVLGAIVAAYYIINYLKKNEENKTKREIEIDSIDKSEHRNLTDNVTQQTNKHHEYKDKYDELEKLSKLKESGIISEEEFIEQKKKILS